MPLSPSQLAALQADNKALAKLNTSSKSAAIKAVQAAFAHDTSGLTADTPPVDPPVNPPVVTPSADGTKVPPASKIVDANLAVWTIINAQVATNGTVDARTNSVDQLAYAAGVLWQHNTFGDWYPQAGTGWGPAQTTDPTGAVTPPPVNPPPVNPPASGVPTMPTAVPAGFTRAFTEDFATDVKIGGWAASPYAARFTNYDGHTDTSGLGICSTAQCLSVSGGSLINTQRTINGQPTVASILPALGDFLYGQIGVCVKGSATGGGYKIAYLLWPKTEAWTSEVDFPEVDEMPADGIKCVSLIYNGKSGGAAGQGIQGNAFAGLNPTKFTFNDGKYHTFLTDWRPGSMTCSIDGTVVFTFTGPSVPAQAMHYVLQAETWIDSGAVPASSVCTIETPWVYINKYTG